MLTVIWDNVQYLFVIHFNIITHLCLNLRIIFWCFDYNFCAYRLFFITCDIRRVQLCVLLTRILSGAKDKRRDSGWKLCAEEIFWLNREDYNRGMIQQRKEERHDAGH